MQSESWWLTNKPLPMQTTIRDGKQLNEITKAHFLMKYEGQVRVINSCNTFLILEMSLVTQMSLLQNVPILSLENISYLKISICRYTICFFSLYVSDVGKWFRMSWHSWSCCGRPGGECSCSGVQWRPGHETFRQGWPGTDCLLLCLCYSVNRKFYVT